MGDIYDTGGIVSSAGRRLQGAVIERATGTDYADALRERILVSLGLEATFFPGWSDRWRTCHGPSGRRGGVRRGCGYVGWTRGAWRIWRHRRDRGRHGSLRTRPVPRFAALRRRPRTLLDFDATHGLPGTDDCKAEAMVYRRDSEFGESWNHGGNTGYLRSRVEDYPRYGVTVAVNLNSKAFPIGIVDRLASEALADALVVAGSSDQGGACETDVAVRDADGTVRTVSTARGFDGMPAWSPDEWSLVLISNRHGQNAVFVGDIAGAAVIQLTDDAAQDDFARWRRMGWRSPFHRTATETTRST
jgi:CubicO group peptidase (beta-lactamase class C family)